MAFILQFSKLFFSHSIHLVTFSKSNTIKFIIPKQFCFLFSYRKRNTLFYGVQIDCFAFKIRFGEDTFLVLGLHKVGCFISNKQFASHFSHSNHFTHFTSFVVKKVNAPNVKNNIKDIISKRKIFSGALYKR